MNGTRNYQSNPDSHKYHILIDRAYILIFICGGLGHETRKGTLEEEMGLGLGWDEKERRCNRIPFSESKEGVLGEGREEAGAWSGVGKLNKNKVCKKMTQ